MNSTYAQKQSPAQNTAVSNAAVVNDCRSLSIAQRVVQRVGSVMQRAPADGKFVYYPDISGEVYKDRVPYEPGKICFTLYTGGEIRSAGFNGCLMMAFKFKNPRNTHPSECFQLLDKDYSLSLEKTYIAHVACGISDQKEALFDAENRGLISIKTIFKPYRNKEVDGPNEKCPQPGNDSVTLAQSANDKLTASLEKINGKWVGKVYNQEKYYAGNNPFSKPNDFIWINSSFPTRNLNAKELRNETISTKIYLYAYVAVKSENLEIKQAALRKLRSLLERTSKTDVNYIINILCGNDDDVKKMIEENRR